MFVPPSLAICQDSPSLDPASWPPRLPSKQATRRRNALSIVTNVPSITHHPSTTEKLLRGVEINDFATPETMPLMTGLLRRRGPTSNAELRRHSFYSAESTNNLPVPVVDSRASEQIPRRLSAADFLSPDAAGDGSSASASGPPAEGGTETLHRTVSPPIQEESQKHRRFSMLKFRHASDSQLATRGA